MFSFYRAAQWETHTLYIWSVRNCGVLLGRYANLYALSSLSSDWSAAAVGFHFEDPCDFCVFSFVRFYSASSVVCFPFAGENTWRSQTLRLLKDAHVVSRWDKPTVWNELNAPLNWYANKAAHCGLVSPSTDSRVWRITISIRLSSE